MCFLHAPGVNLFHALQSGPRKLIVHKMLNTFSFFLLQCCAHHDDGDSLGMNDDLVHQMLKRGKTRHQTKTTKTAPNNKQTKTTKQNTGSPPESETVKQAFSE